MKTMEPSAMPPAAFTLERNAFGRLVLRLADGTVIEDVVPVRAFALSAPDEGLALVDRTGKEWLWIPRLSDLPDKPRKLIASVLAEREFLPVIERIVSVSSFATPSTWRVETDRGATRLVLKSEDDIRRLKTPGGLLIADGNGLTFLIRDWRTLDATSRKLLKRFL